VPLRAELMERLWSDAEQAYRAKILATLTPAASARLLDVGCDDGVWTDEVRRKLGIPSDRVYGLEIVPQRAELARSRGFEVRSGDVEDRWPFDDGSFDVVHANQVIEHVRRLDHFVEETRRVLGPAGCAIVCTENLASWHNVAALTLGYQPFSLANISNCGPLGNPLSLHVDDVSPGESWQHVHVVTLRALRDLFSEHDFVVERTWGAGYHPFFGRVASAFAALDPRHAHFIGIVARARS
jgi:SAM-dependent methyltransferase